MTARITHQSRLLGFHVQVLGLALACFGVLVGTAGAITFESKPKTKVTYGLSGSPARMTLPMNPGETRVEQIRFKNRTGKTADLTISTANITSDATDFLRIADEARYGASKWVTPEVTKVTLKHGDAVRINTTITVPTGAEPGSHYAVVSGALGQPVSPVKGESVAAFKSALAIQLFINVAGERVISGKVVQTESPRILQRKQGSYVPVRVRYQNTGNITNELTGKVRFTSIFGKTVESIPIKRGIVLRGSERNFDVVWNDPPWIGRFTPVVTVTALDGKQETRRLRPVWVVPPWPYAVALGIALLLPLARMWIRRRREISRYMDDIAAEESFPQD